MNDMPQDPFGDEDELHDRLLNGAVIGDQLNAMDAEAAALAVLNEKTLSRDDLANVVLAEYTERNLRAQASGDFLGRTRSC